MLAHGQNVQRCGLAMVYEPIKILDSQLPRSKKKIIQHLSASKHIKVSTTSLFNVCQGYSKSLWEYLAQFNEDTIKVSHLNQEMFVGAFQHGLKVGQFIESLTQKTTINMDDVTTRVECYIKGEENNMEKRSCDAKERAHCK